MSSSAGVPRQPEPEGAPVQATPTEATWSRWTCVLCNTIMNTKNISSHLHGGNHTKKLDQARKLASNRSNDAPTPDGWRCQLCERSFPVDDIESHLCSVEHRQKAISHVPLSRKNKKRRAAAEAGQGGPAGPSDDARRDSAAEQTQATQATVGRGHSYWHGGRRGGAGRGRRGRGGGGDGETGNVETGVAEDNGGQGVDNATDVCIDGASAGGGGEGAAPRSRGRGRGGRRGRGRGGGRGGGGGGGDDGGDSPGEGGSCPSHGRGRGGLRSGRGTGRASSSTTEVEYTNAELLELYYEARSGFGVLHGFEASGYTSD